MLPNIWFSGIDGSLIYGVNDADVTTKAFRKNLFP